MTLVPPGGAARLTDTSLPGATPCRGQGRGSSGAAGIPRDTFNAIYLAEPAAACAGELVRLAAAQGLEVADLIAAGRIFSAIAVQDLPVLDLRGDTARERSVSNWPTSPTTTGPPANRWATRPTSSASAVSWPLQLPVSAWCCQRSNSDYGRAS